MRLGLVIPLYDEEELVTEVVASIHATLKQAGIEHVLVLVNNGSQDQTAALVDDLSLDASVVAIHLRENAGYGGGILAGLAWLEQNEMPDVVGWIWGDGQVSPSALPPLFAACAAGAPLAKAVRKERHDGLQRQAITTVYAAATRVLGIHAEDVNGCPKLMTRAAFEELQPRSSDWFLDAEVVVKAEQRNWEIATHPVIMRARTAGHSKVNWHTVAEFALNLTRWRFGSAE